MYWDHRPQWQTAVCQWYWSLSERRRPPAGSSSWVKRPGSSGTFASCFEAHGVDSALCGDCIHQCSHFLHVKMLMYSTVQGETLGSKGCGRGQQGLMSTEKRPYIPRMCPARSPVSHHLPPPLQIHWRVYQPWTDMGLWWHLPGSRPESQQWRDARSLWSPLCLFCCKGVSSCPCSSGCLGFVLARWLPPGWIQLILRPSHAQTCACYDTGQGAAYCLGQRKRCQKKIKHIGLQ